MLFILYVFFSSKGGGGGKFKPVKESETKGPDAF